MFKKILLSLCAAVLISPAHATIVQFQTSLGSFEVNLYDEATPMTVANFLAYVEAGDYSDAIFHRSVPGFVVQGGGFAFIDGKLELIERNPPVINEPLYSNVRGSISMAKVDGDPNSATNQWFINLSDNSYLDKLNGGFTVFGEVVGSGMAVLDAIAELPTYENTAASLNGHPHFEAIPLRNSPEANQPVDEDNFMFIQSIVVLDASLDTAADLDPPKSEVEATPEEDPPVATKKKKKGGSLDFWVLAMMAGLGVFKLSRSSRS